MLCIEMPVFTSEFSTKQKLFEDNPICTLSIAITRESLNPFSILFDGIIIAKFFFPETFPISSLSVWIAHY